MQFSNYKLLYLRIVRPCRDNFLHIVERGFGDDEYNKIKQLRLAGIT
jgi:hypothetical protein